MLKHNLTAFHLNRAVKFTPSPDLTLFDKAPAGNVE